MYWKWTEKTLMVLLQEEFNILLRRKLIRTLKANEHDRNNSLDILLDVETITLRPSLFGVASQMLFLAFEI